MRILHSYCLNYNIGDYALGMGVKSLFREHFPVDFFGETNLQGRVFNEYYIDEVVNKRYDLLVIGGGGIIHGAHWPNGWFWLIDIDLIRRIKIPFIIFAAGNNYFKSEGDIPAKAITHLRETARCAKFFSVRNDGSYERISEYVDFDPIEQPDPGFHIPKSQTPFVPCREDYVIVQLAADKIEHRFGSMDNVRLFKNDLVKTLKLISKDFRIVLVPHVFDDFLFSREIASELPHSICLDFGKYAFDHAPKVVEMYQSAKLVLAMRGHAQIIPIGFEVPVFSLYNHDKHLGLLKKLGLENYGISALSPGLSDNLSSLYFEIVNNYADYKAKLFDIRQMLNQQTAHAFKILRSKLVAE